ncbi:hypothetical protein Z517_03141 [Fonsecaea pedrosoi CBS 271.37]|uniref:Prefoldin subunit 2 n=1 Tax=Fonsecaea pedrosoi CBS 271.37 TaxID=1442368 RepID=A0A0D2GZ60_9EURO|nr:uncharacterized protein Z517_03141 [Fonsecaea pedrosoi CBS 271.37]KIW83895.1 hypothetical protein Z517_03141 [Fonsecaea pedrosoi CBS 271.37]
MASGQEAALRKQQGIWRPDTSQTPTKSIQDLQSQYTNYKNTLQSLAQKVGEIEQEIEEHKSVTSILAQVLFGANISQRGDARY